MPSGGAEARFQRTHQLRVCIEDFSAEIGTSMRDAPRCGQRRASANGGSVGWRALLTLFSRRIHWRCAHLIIVSMRVVKSGFATFVQRINIMITQRVSFASLRRSNPVEGSADLPAFQLECSKPLFYLSNGSKLTAFQLERG